MYEGVTLSGGPHAHLLQKDVEIKSKFYGAKSDCKKNIHFNLDIIQCAKFMPIAFELQHVFIFI